MMKLETYQRPAIFIWIMHWSLTVSMLVWLVFISPFFCIKHGLLLGIEIFHLEHVTHTRAVIADNLIESARKVDSPTTIEWQGSTCHFTCHNAGNQLVEVSLRTTEFADYSSPESLRLPPPVYPIQPIVLPPLTPPRVSEA